MDTQAGPVNTRLPGMSMGLRSAFLITPGSFTIPCVGMVVSTRSVSLNSKGSYPAFSHGYYLHANRHASAPQSGYVITSDNKTRELQRASSSRLNFVSLYVQPLKDSI